MLAKIKEKINNLIKKGKNIYKPHRDDVSSPLKHIYTDKFGNRYYELENVMAMNNSRAIQAGIATESADYCLTKESLKKIVLEMKKYGNEGNIVDMFKLLTELEHRIDYCAEEETLLNLATVYFIDEYEDVEAYNILEQNRKKEIWKKDPKAMSFFLREAFKYTRNYMNLSEQDMVPYLKMLTLQEKMINNILQRESTVISTS